MIKTVNFNKYLGWLFAVLAVLAGVHTLVWLSKDPTLWVDDSALMKSVVTRDFAGLFDGNLDYNQSAPIGWLLIVKSFETAFGNTTIVLRLTGVVLYFLSAWIVYLLSKNAFKFNIPMMPVAVFMSLYIFQSYAIATKPYMADVCFSLLTLWVYHKHLQGKIPSCAVFFLIALFVWFAFGALFVIGGVCAFHFFSRTVNLCRKRIVWPEYLKDVAPLFVVLLSVGLYYLLWALPASKNTPSVNEDNYWTFLSFPLIPRSIDDLRLMRRMVDEFFSPVGPKFFWQFLVGFALAVKMLWRRWYMWAFLIMALLVMVVSSVGLYPIAIRLILSQFAFAVLLALWGVDYIVGRVAKNIVTIALLLLLIFLPMARTIKMGLVGYHNCAFHMCGEQYKACLDYVYKVKSPEAKIYVIDSQRPTAEYYCDYEVSSNHHEQRILEKNDKIWGTSYRWLHCTRPYEYRFFMLPEKVKANIAAIAKYDDVYLIDTHGEGYVFTNFLSALRKTGAKVEKVYSCCYSNVWRYRK